MGSYFPSLSQNNSLSLFSTGAEAERRKEKRLSSKERESD